MAPKKEKSKPMSLQELDKKLGIDREQESLPSKSGSVVAPAGNGYRKGMRGDSPSRADGEWDRRGGKGGDDRKGGKRHNEEESRADTGDWRSKDRTLGSDRGGFNSGDRDRRPPRDRDQRDDNGAAAQDSNWRGVTNRDRDTDRPNNDDRRNGDDRRDDRRSFSNWRDDDDGDRFGRSRGGDAPSERPRLNLKPKTVIKIDENRDECKMSTDTVTSTGQRKYIPPSQRKHLQEEPKADDDLSRRQSVPWRGSKQATDDGNDAEGSDGFKTVARGAKNMFASKYVPPSRTSEPVKPVVVEKDDDSNSDSGSDKDGDRSSFKKTSYNEEEKEKGRVATQPNGITDDDRRPPPRQTMTEANEGFELLKKGSTSGGKYVPPSQRKAEEERKKNQEAEQKKAEEERKNKEAAEEARAAKMTEEERNEEKQRKEKQEQKHKEKKERQAKEEQKKAEKQKEVEERKRIVGNDEVAKPVNEEKLNAFGEKCRQVVDESAADVKKLVAEVPKLLGEMELRTIEPMKRLLEPLLSFCRRKEDAEVSQAVERFAPLLKCLIDQAQMRRCKMKLLREAQRVAFLMGLPRLSPASALLESFFDGLYRANVVEEHYFGLWSEDTKDDTPGKIEAIFQLNDFLDWLRNAKVEGKESDTEEDDNEDTDEEEDEEDDDDDIEANVPQRGRRPLR